MDRDHAQTLQDAKARCADVTQRLLLQILSEVGRVMKRDKITQTQISVRMDVSRSYVSQLLSGSENITIETLGKLCGAVGCREPVFMLEPPAAPARKDKV